MHRGPRPPLLATLFAVAVYAAGLVTMAGLVRWGWPVFDAACAGAAVAILALWSSLWAGRKRASRRRSTEDRADR
jgi:hypothetical protein